MINLQQISGFDWDDGNSSKINKKHAVTPLEAEQVFTNSPLLLFDDLTHSETEKRFHAYGKTNAGRHLQLAFTLRQHETLLRVISARPMSAKERARYDKEV